MKQAFKRLYDVPVLGYLLRTFVGISKLPLYLRTHEESIRGVQAWVAQADAMFGRFASRQEVAESRVVALEASDSEVNRIATEAHNQATYLTHRMESVGQHAFQAESAIDRLRVGIDQHLPAVLGHISTNGAIARGLQREVLALQGEAADLVERLESLEKQSTDFSCQISDIQSSARTFREGTESGLGKLESRISRVDSQDPSLDDRVARNSAHEEPGSELRVAIDALRGNVSYLLQRVEFVRREVLFELRYRNASPNVRPLEITTRIVNEAKVAAAAREGMRINVGCGHIPLDGYVNVDQRELPGVDVVAEAGSMPFVPGSLAEIYSAHLLEHFPREQLRREILPYWKSLLRPDGVFRSVVPDAATMIDKYKNGELPWDEFREVTFGGQDYSGDFHYDMFTPESLTALLEEAGFHDVSFPAIGRANGQCFEMELVAQA